MDNRPNIQFIAAVCPDCGGELRVPEDRNQIKCMYCGHDIIIHDPNKILIEVKPNIDNLLSLANTALEGRNYEEAYSYYSRILESDPKIYLAWLGKAVCAGMLSSFMSSRIPEMIELYTEGYLNYIGTPEYYEDNIINSQFNVMTRKMIDILSIANQQFTKHYLEYITDDDTAIKFFKLRAEIIRAIDEIQVLPLDVIREPLLLLGIKILQEGLDGWKFYDRDKGGFSATRVRKYRDEPRAAAQRIFNLYVAKLKEINPRYIPPKLREKQDDCFIATATLNNYDHPYILVLQEYRDKMLVNNQFGRKFIKAYYHYGPFFARLIKKSRILRKFSLYLLVKPSVIVARNRLRKY